MRAGLSGNFTATTVTKKTKPFKVEEHILVISRTLLGQTVSIAGVHLSAKNVNASSTDQRTSVKELTQFCASNSIDLAVGDFNLDVRDHTSDGGVGRIPDTTVFLAQQHKSTMGVRFQEQFSNSANDKHFMGYLSATSQLQVKSALSLKRSIAGVYFSDHPPLFLDLEEPPSAPLVLF